MNYYNLSFITERYSAQDNKVQIYDSVSNQWSFGSRSMSPILPVAASTVGGWYLTQKS